MSMNMKIEFSSRLSDDSEQVFDENGNLIDDGDDEFWGNDPEWVAAYQAVDAKMDALAKMYPHAKDLIAKACEAASCDARYVPYDVNTELDKKFLNIK